MRRASIACALVLLPAVAVGQRAELTYRWATPEGRLMGYYSAALAFTPVSAPQRPAGLRFGLELAWIPPLDEARRSGGFSRTESTNLVPLLPRPRVAFALPWSLTGEVSYVPPIRLFDVKASLLSGSLARPVGLVRGYRLTGRLSGSSGITKAAITCNDDIIADDPGNQLFFTYVCHDRESEDHFHSPAVAAELLAVRGDGGGTLVPWAGIGVRHEWTKFYVGVRNFDGTPDPNQPTLAMRITRPFGMLGATWRRWSPADLSGELFYAPGSLVTVRLMAATTWNAWRRGGR